PRVGCNRLSRLYAPDDARRLGKLGPSFEPYCRNRAAGLCHAHNGFRPLVSRHTAAFDRSAEAIDQGTHGDDCLPYRHHSRLVDRFAVRAEHSVCCSFEGTNDSARNHLLAENLFGVSGPDLSPRDYLDYSQDSSHTSRNRIALFGGGGVVVW